jgi:hypothetical protein
MFADDPFTYSRHQSHTPRKIPIVTLVVVILMYIMCLALWVIDLVILIGETRMTLIKDPDVDLEVKYGRAIDFMTPRIAAIDAIYAYLVCRAYLFLRVR